MREPRNASAEASAAGPGGLCCCSSAGGTAYPGHLSPKPTSEAALLHGHGEDVKMWKEMFQIRVALRLQHESG